MNTTTLETNLTKENVGHLNDLIQINLDSEAGFRETRDLLNNPDYQRLFDETAQERSRQASELKGLVRSEGEDPETDRSLLGKAHQWWINVRDKVSDHSDYDVLAEAERGEDKILELYRETVKETNTPDLNQFLERHLRQVKTRHDQVRNLRDTAKADTSRQ